MAALGASGGLAGDATGAGLGESRADSASVGVAIISTGDDGDRPAEYQKWRRLGAR